MSGFKSPNHTQVPNDFFDMIPSMSDTELRVTLVMIRETHGWHRDAAKIGKKEMADRSGLSFNGVTAGCEAARVRGTFRRTNPDAKTKAEWELISDDEPSASEGVNPHPVRIQPSASEGQVGVKESINKEKDMIDHLLDMSQFPGAKREARVNSILSYLGETFHVNTETKKWRDFAKYVDDRQMNFGEDVKIFTAWVLRQDKFSIQFWPPFRMMELWPAAFVKNEKDGKGFNEKGEETLWGVPLSKLAF